MNLDKYIFGSDQIKIDVMGNMLENGLNCGLRAYISRLHANLLISTVQGINLRL